MSVITLLPKEGKDAKDIKNWRPITLTNCDAKIITKALVIRMNKVMDEKIRCYYAVAGKVLRKQKG